MPTPPRTAAIAESLIQPHSIINDEEESAGLPIKSASTTTAGSSLLSTALSIDSESEGIEKIPQILLQGPAESGRSSLAMDLAVEMAAKAPCRCNSRQCICKPVAFLRPASKADSFFPMRCCRSEVDDSGAGFHQRMQQLLKTPQARDDGATWDPNTLRRIQVHHLTSFRDCLQYLLCLQGKPSYEQPYSAIIIDDIDCLSEECPGGNKEGSSGMQVAQFLAILFDTVNFLKFRPTLCVSINSKSDFSTDCFMASFFTFIVSLKGSLPDEQTSPGAYCQNTDDVVLSSWDLCIKKENAGEGKKSAEFIVCRMRNENHRIRWKRVRV